MSSLRSAVDNMKSVIGYSGTCGCDLCKGYEQLESALSAPDELAEAREILKYARDRLRDFRFPHKSDTADWIDDFLKRTEGT